jgi:hypothetical protein
LQIGALVDPGDVKNGDTAYTKAGTGKFKPGNPGRKLGSRNKAALLAEAMFGDAAEKIINKAIERAIEGDSTAIRLCLDRIAPPRKERALTFALPPMLKADDAATAMAAITAAVAAGELTLGEAESAAKLVDAFARAIEIGEFGQRLKALEDRQA